MKNEEVIAWLLELCARGLGPHGQGVACVSSIVRVSCDCTEALRQVVEWLKVEKREGSNGEEGAAASVVKRRLAVAEHPFTKVVFQTIRAHTAAFGDGGWFLLHTTTSLLSWAHQQTEQLPPPLIHFATTLCRDWSKEVLHADFLAGRVDTMCASHLITVASQKFSTNAVLDLSERETAWIASRVTRLFLAATDVDTGKIDLSCMRYLKVSSHEGSVMDSDLVDGILIDWPLPLECEIMTAQKCKQTEDPHGAERKESLEGTRVLVGSGRTALFEPCMEPVVTWKYGDVVKKPLDVGDDVAGWADKCLENPHSAAESVARNQTGFRNLLDLLAMLKKQGVTVVACQKTIHQAARLWCALNGIVALERLSIRHIDAFRKATGSVLMTDINPETLDPSALGTIHSLSEVSFGGRKYMRIDGTRKVQTLVLRHSQQQCLEELELACERAVKCIISSIKDSRVCPGAGVTESAIAAYLDRKVRLADHSKASLIARLPPSATAQVLRVVSAFARALSSWAERVAPSPSPRPAAGLRPGVAAAALDALAAASLNVDPLTAQRSLLPLKPPSITCRSCTMANKPNRDSYVAAKYVLNARVSDSKMYDPHTRREAIQASGAEVDESDKRASDDEAGSDGAKVQEAHADRQDGVEDASIMRQWLQDARQHRVPPAVAKPCPHCRRGLVFGCAAPPHSVARGNRTAVPGALPPADSGGGGGGSNSAAAAAAVREYRSFHARARHPFTLRTVASFGPDGRVSDLGGGYKLPIVDSVACKEQALASALDLVALLLRTDTFVVDTT
ncbi:Thermosome subunit beta [Diplonema papillatum]|nr:Thermosome subunit beta [Diplonema papillatum]